MTVVQLAWIKNPDDFIVKIVYYRELQLLFIKHIRGHISVERHLFEYGKLTSKCKSWVRLGQASFRKVSVSFFKNSTETDFPLITAI